MNSPEIQEHKGSSLNNALKIQRLQDGANGGGACYAVSHIDSIDGPVTPMTELKFQDGPIPEGVNGITDEVLIAIVLDRLRGFNEGTFRCRENSLAITHFEEGLMWLQKRTARRQAEGVEGTHKL